MQCSKKLSVVSLGAIHIFILIVQRMKSDFFFSCVQFDDCAIGRETEINDGEQLCPDNE